MNEPQGRRALGSANKYNPKVRRKVATGCTSETGCSRQYSSKGPGAELGQSRPSLRFLVPCGTVGETTSVSTLVIDDLETQSVSVVAPGVTPPYILARVVLALALERNLVPRHGIASLQDQVFVSVDVTAVALELMCPGPVRKGADWEGHCRSLLCGRWRARWPWRGRRLGCGSGWNRRVRWRHRCGCGRRLGCAACREKQHGQRQANQLRWKSSVIQHCLLV